MPSQQITGRVAALAAIMGLVGFAPCASAQTYFGDESERTDRSWDKKTGYFSISGLVIAPQDSDIAATDEGTNALLQSYEPSMEFDLSAGVSVAYGSRVARNVRVELQYTYMDIKMDALSTTAGRLHVENNSSIHALMLNAYYDFPFTLQFQPYLGAGIGIAYHWSKFHTEPNPDIQFNIERSWSEAAALQLMAGIGYNLDRTTTLNAGIRYFVTEDPELEPITMESTAFVFEFGIRLNF